MSVLEGVRRGARGFAWFVKGVMGEDAYDKYKSHHEAVHGNAGTDSAGAQALMTEREFWRDQTDRQDANPQGRCC